MSEQLTLGELVDTQDAPTKTSTDPKPKIAVSPAKANSLDERLKRALEVEQRYVTISNSKNTREPSQQAPQFPAQAPAPNENESSPKKAEPAVLTVTDLNKQIKGILEKTYPFIWVKGEISNFKVPSSGHMYFTLKDSGAQIRAVMFKGFAQHMKFKPEDGMEVLVRARVTVYEPRGDYQLFCEVMEPVGYGALQVAFEKLKAQLQKEGLFEIAKKKPMPSFPQKIGIITSPTGAAIKDMLNVLGRRFGEGLDITILPVAVQGDKAPGEIARAVKLANNLKTQEIADGASVPRFDVLIVGRGGGSLEDLWAFNTEEVARAVAGSIIPTISAVGHEVDFTICDFVADLRAPTPSAAAELVVKNKADLTERVRLITRQMTQLTVKKLQLGRSKIENVSKRLIDPKRRLQDLMLRCDEWSDRLVLSIQRYISDTELKIRFLLEKLPHPEAKVAALQQRVLLNQTQLAAQIKKILQNKQKEFSNKAVMLDSLSPLAVLDRGYSIVKNGESIIKDAAQLKSGDEIQIKLSRGQTQAKII